MPDYLFTLCSLTLKPLFASERWGTSFRA